MSNLTPPPKTIPEHLHAAFTLNSAIPVYPQYRDDSAQPDTSDTDGTHNTPYLTQEMYDSAFWALDHRRFEYYGNDMWSFYDALEDYKEHIEGKNVLIWGLIYCNCDAFALWKKAKKVYVVDYNPITSDHEDFIFITHEELANLDMKFDAAFSFSSFEHDGLGRYGDPLSPYGDILAMQKAQKVMTDDGVLFFGVPMGKDLIVWNLHRIYGEIRLPMMLSGWEVLDAYSCHKNENIFTMHYCEHIQPLLVLRKTPQRHVTKKAILERIEQVKTAPKQNPTINYKILLQILDFQLKSKCVLSS